MRNIKNLRYEKPEALFTPPLSLRNVKKQQQQQQKKVNSKHIFLECIFGSLVEYN